MRNVKELLARFMYGRYGVDQLYRAAFAVLFGLIIANAFINSGILYVLVWGILIWMMFRTLSRNMYKRQLENEKFLRIWNRVKSKGSLTIRRVKEIRTHRFRTCPQCTTVLRLPRKSGKHTVKCPRCRHEFEVRVML